MPSATARPSTTPVNMPIRKPPAARLRLAGADPFALLRWGIHLLRRADADQRQPVGQRLADCGAQREARRAQLLVLDEDALGIIVAVKLRSELAQVEGHVVRRCLARRDGNHLRICLLYTSD